MQTFLPYADYEKSAQALDRQRLGKQRVEAMQIFKALLAEYEGTDYGWKNHPATRMWRGHAMSLANYAIIMCVEWMGRGYEDTCSRKISDLRLQIIKYEPKVKPPCWLGDEAFHDSHKSNLLRKLPAHYSQFGWEVSDALPYVWPSPKE